MAETLSVAVIGAGMTGEVHTRAIRFPAQRCPALRHRIKAARSRQTRKAHAQINPRHRFLSGLSTMRCQRNDRFVAGQ
jgi:hypothetical protein